MSAIPLTARTIIQGDTFRGRLTIVNPDGTAKDLTGASVRWALYLGTSLAIGPFDLGSGVEFEGAASLGIVVVTASSAATELIFGGHHQEWLITDSASDVQKWIGKFFVTGSQLEAA